MKILKEKVEMGRLPQTEKTVAGVESWQNVSVKIRCFFIHSALK